MARHPASRPGRPSRRRKKKAAPVGLIVGLSLGGVFLLGAIVAIVVISGGGDNQTPEVNPIVNGPGAETARNPLGLENPAIILAEPVP